MEASKSRTAILITAWVVILLASFAVIVLGEIFHFSISENLKYGITAGIVLVGFALTFPWKTIRPLRAFFGLFIILASIQWLVYTRVDQWLIVRSWLSNRSFNVYMLAEQFLNLIVTLTVITFLFILFRKRESFFLARGDLSAHVEPIKGLWTKTGTPWNKFGLVLALILSLGTLLFLLLAGRPPVDIVVKALPFLPMVLLTAALNSFNEEMTYKASFLSVLVNVVGKQQSLLLMAVYFGALHFYGVPYGITGVLMATFLGWLLGKSMLETRGLFWAWFIHFLQDVFIFTFLAIGSITPGG